MILFKEPLEFEWDRGNLDKNLIKHKVTSQECEEVFFEPDKKVLEDVLHSGKEERYIILGQTRYRRLLFIVFTIRSSKVRVISAREVNKEERKLYGKSA